VLSPAISQSLTSFSVAAATATPPSPVADATALTPSPARVTAAESWLGGRPRGGARIPRSPPRVCGSPLYRLYSSVSSSVSQTRLMV